MRKRSAGPGSPCGGPIPSLGSSPRRPDWSKIETKVEKVAGNVYMLYGVGGFAGGNIGVSVGDDGVVLVDDQFEPLVPKIEAALKGITPKAVRFVLNTHFHGDHTPATRSSGGRRRSSPTTTCASGWPADDSFDNKPGTRAPRTPCPS